MSIIKLKETVKKINFDSFIGLSRNEPVVVRNEERDGLFISNGDDTGLFIYPGMDGKDGLPGNSYRGFFQVSTDLEDIPTFDLTIGSNADVMITNSKWIWNISYIGDKFNYEFPDINTLFNYYELPAVGDFFYNSSTNTIWEFTLNVGANEYSTERDDYSFKNTGVTYPPFHTVQFDTENLPLWDGDEEDEYNPETLRWINTLFPISIQGPKGDKGDKGDTPYVGVNNNWWYNGTDSGFSAEGPIPTIGINENWFLNDVDTGKPSRGAKGEPGDVGTTYETTLSYAGVNSNIVRIGNTVMWSFNGTAGTVTTNTISYGYRPALSTTFYSGQSQGATPKNVTVSPSGLISVNQALAGATSFTTIWVTKDTSPL